MAPRQQQRKLPNGKSVFADVNHAVSEYRQKYPEKAVTYYAQGYPEQGWAVLMAGGSCCQVTLNEESLLHNLPSMKITDVGQNAKALSNGTSSLVYFTNDGDAYLSGIKPGKHILKQISKDGQSKPAGKVIVSSDGTCRLSGKANQIYYIQ